MIGYICKYTPIGIIESFGEEARLMNPYAADVTRADAMLHPNICSFIKAVLEEFAHGGYSGMVLTTCCDSSRRLFDVLRREYPDKFFYQIDLPRKINEFSTDLFAKSILGLAEAYGDFCGKSFDARELVRICDKKKAEYEETEARAGKESRGTSGVRATVGLAGARPDESFKELLKDAGIDVAFDMTCVDTKRVYNVSLPDVTDAGEDEQWLLVRRYAAALLNQLPCMRMADASGREKLIETLGETADGIIYHTVKFCDIYSYEYARLKERTSLPILAIETDASGTAGGQSLTRIEAFVEEIRKGGGSSGERSPVTGDAKEAMPDAGSPEAAESRRTEKKMYSVGIDSGSTSTNAVIMDMDKNIVAWDVVRTGAKSIESASRAFENVIKKAGCKKDDIGAVISTGYGRVSIPFADKNITEITCHARGAVFLNPEVRTIIDIGGQDSKAIKLDESGSVADFVMNDKCAAGTGRFLEMMARTLELEIDKMGQAGLKYKENIEISSMCTVFAESEVISLIAQNKNTADIIHGLNRAVARKAMSLLRRTGITPVIMMTGGVAKNAGVVAALEEETKEKLFVYEQPDIVGAIGAAIFGADMIG